MLDEQSGDVPLIVLRDEAGGIEAAIAPGKGGELSGLKIRVGERWVETLYLARDYAPRKGWTGKGPFLWPATGSNARVLPAGRQPGYDYQGRDYPIPAHGFARDFPWKMEKRSADASGARVLLSFVDSERTRRYYPFGFRVTVEYVTVGGRLEIGYRVASSKQNTDKMFFSAGNHITFRAPWFEGTKPEEMLFTTPSNVELLKGPEGPTGETRPRSFAKPTPLAEIERLQAVSLAGYREPYIVLRDPAGLALRMSHSASSIPPDPVVLFNVWGDASQGYFSPEPWVGLQNSFNLRKGLVYLAPGETWNWKIRIEPER